MKDFTNLMKIEGLDAKEIKECVNKIFNLFIEGETKECVAATSIIYIYNLFLSNGIYSRGETKKIEEDEKSLIRALQANRFASENYMSVSKPEPSPKPFRLPILKRSL